MVKLLSVLFFFLITFSTFSQLTPDFKMPETWEKDFVITLSFHSSMSGGKTEVKFTFDSCTYMDKPTHSNKAKNGKYKMKESDRVVILKKLKELKSDQIKTASRVYAVNDGWSQSICFNGHCIEGGTSVEMSEADKNQFLDTYQFLEDFATKRAR